MRSRACSPGLAALIVGLQLAGCANPLRDSEDRVFTAKSSELLYLTAVDTTRLHVEVDVVQGFGDVSDVVAILEAALSRSCKKPDGIVVSLDAPLPVAATRGRSRSAIAIEHMSGPPTGEVGVDPPTAYLYVLVDDSERSGILPYNPHVRPEYRCAIFYDDAYVRRAARQLAEATGSDFDAWYARTRREVLLHELGHVLGLVRNPEHRAATHCTTTNCRSAAILSAASEEEWCQECLDDLAASGASTDSQPLRFHGPALVRSADDYWVVYLPGSLEITFLSPFDSDWREVRARALEDEAALDQVNRQLLFDHPAELDLRTALENAARDPDPLVAGLVRQALAQWK